MPTKELTDRAYDFITEDDDRSCENIPESACKEAPGNFFKNAFNGTSTKLAEQIASPGLVLPWLLSAIGAPATLSGFLVPINRGGSLLPQLAVSGRIRAFDVRKWFWVGAGVTQGIALLLIALVTLLMQGLIAGILILILLAIFSIASGVGSVSFKDVLAKTIPKGKRGTLLSVRATLGGLLGLIAGWVIHTYVGDGEDVSIYVMIILAASALWFIAALLFALIKEEPGATDGGRSAIEESKKGFYLLKKQPAFAKFIAVRSLLLSIQLAVPFYAILGRDFTGTELSSLGIFVIANSLAMVLSSYFWGRFADRSSKFSMVFGGIIGIVAGLFAVFFYIIPENLHSDVLYSAVFFITGIGHAGVRIGRKTYLVDAAPELDRPLYVSVSNTIVGIVTLSSAALGLLADLISVEFLIGLFVAFMIAGVILAMSLPKAEEMVVSSDSDK